MCGVCPAASCWFQPRPKTAALTKPGNGISSRIRMCAKPGPNTTGMPPRIAFARNKRRFRREDQKFSGWLLVGHLFQHPFYLLFYAIQDSTCAPAVQCLPWRCWLVMSSHNQIARVALELQLNLLFANCSLSVASFLLAEQFA